MKFLGQGTDPVQVLPVISLSQHESKQLSVSSAGNFLFCQELDRAVSGTKTVNKKIAPLDFSQRPSGQRPLAKRVGRALAPGAAKNVFNEIIQTYPNQISELIAFD